MVYHKFNYVIFVGWCWRYCREAEERLPTRQLFGVLTTPKPFDNSSLEGGC